MNESYESSRHNKGVPHVKESRQTQEWTHRRVETHMNESYESSRHKKGVPHVNESRHTQEWTHM